MPDTRFITEFDQYLFGQGTHYDLYNKLGAHPMTVDEDTDGTFRTTWNLSDISYRDKSGRYL